MYPPKLSCPQTEQSQISQPFVLPEMLLSPHHLLAPFTRVSAVGLYPSCAREPRMGPSTVGVASPKWSRRKGSCPAGNIGSTADQDTNHLFRKGTAFACVQKVWCSQRHPGPFWQHCFWDGGPAAHAGVWNCFFLGAALSTFHSWISQGSCQPICSACRGPSGSTAVCCINHSSKVCVISRLAEGAHSVSHHMDHYWRLTQMERSPASPLLQPAPRVAAPKPQAVWVVLQSRAAPALYGPW